MIKIICDKDNRESAEIILKLVQKHQICPPCVDCSPAANCDQCIAEWLEIEVINGTTELERLKEQVEHERLKEEKERAIRDIDLYIADAENDAKTPSRTGNGYYIGLKHGLQIAKEILQGIRGHG